MTKPVLPIKTSQHQKSSIGAVEHELERRQMEALRIYEPMPFQDAFHRCAAKEAVLMKGNQAGGSVAGFVEVARAVTGTDPYNKYPKENGIVACLGYGEKHVGRVMHRYLFRAGTFRMIKDATTKLWRVYRPWPSSQVINKQAGDADRYAESKPSLPLIPQRMIKEISWDKRADNIFSRVQLTNGWQIYAYNTVGDYNHAAGFQANLIHIDEDTGMEGWYNEMLQRTMIPKGLMRWTALPLMRNSELTDVLDRAESESGTANPNSVLIRATAYDNIYYPEESKKANEKILKQQGEDVWRRRMLGEMVLDSILMYPTFSTQIHDAIKRHEPRAKIQEVLTEREGEPPRDWCRYMVIDPGHVVCAVTFFAVPPPTNTSADTYLGDHVVQYDELYLKNCDVGMLTRAVKAKVSDYVFEEFIIDAHGGRLRELATGFLPMDEYSKAFAEAGIRSVKTGSSFRYGSDRIMDRVTSLREWLSIRENGSSKFLMVVARCVNTANEFKKFKRKTVTVGGSTVYTDDGERRNTHAVETCEYAAAHGMPYVKPKVMSTTLSTAARIMAQVRERAAIRAARYGTADSQIQLGPT